MSGDLRRLIPTPNPSAHRLGFLLVVAWGGVNGLVRAIACMMTRRARCGRPGIGTRGQCRKSLVKYGNNHGSEADAAMSASRQKRTIVSTRTAQTNRSYQRT